MKTMNRTCIVLLLVVALLTACGKPQPKTFTIGIVNFSPTLDAVVDGFKAGMTERGYVEGENVTYVYEGVVANIDALDPAIQKLMAEDLDLMFSLTTPATQKVKQAFAGTDIPIVFAPVTDPVTSGVVDNLTNPGGNITGIRTGGSIPKGLAWLLAIAPGTTRLFVPHNPDDGSSVQGLAELTEPAVALDLELVMAEARTADELAAAMDVIPEDVDAIFMLPSGVFSRQVATFVDTTVEHKLPAVSVGPHCEAGMLICYGHYYPPMGKQASRLADQILQGAAPGNLPVENAEFFLGINLQTAQAIGLDIPDDILQQADYLVR